MHKSAIQMLRKLKHEGGCLQLTLNFDGEGLNETCMECCRWIQAERSESFRWALHDLHREECVEKDPESLDKAKVVPY